MADGMVIDHPAVWPAPYAEGAPSPWIGQLLMGLPVAMAFVSRAGDLVVGNDAFKATMGAGFKPGTRPEGLVVVEDAPRIAAAVTRAIAGTSSEVRAALTARPDEKQVITIIPVPPGLGISVVLALRDIREQLRLEAQVAASTRMQAVGQLAGGIAHDFNNILTAVLALTEQLLDRHPAGDIDHDSLGEIQRNGNRAAALVAQLLAFARQQPQRQQVLDLVPLVTALRPLLSQLLGQGVELTIDDAPLPAAVRADPGQIEQVIVNLAVNARDAMAGKGELRIGFRHVAAADIAAQGHRIIPHADHIVIDVIDSGTGIAQAISGKIFEPFFTTKPMGQGTGLGLSTVYGVVKQSGGFIFAAPAPGGQGTMFSVFLPAVPRLDAPAEAIVPAGAATGTETLAGVRLLLVEDEPAVRAVLERALKRYGAAIETAADASFAITALSGERGFDVLVSDIMMPGIDGVELAMRARVLRPGIGVVLMSGFAEAPLYRAADAQGVRFLSKPFALAELVAVIAETHAARL